VCRPSRPVLSCPEGKITPIMKETSSYCWNHRYKSSDRMRSVKRVNCLKISTDVSPYLYTVGCSLLPPTSLCHLIVATYMQAEISAWGCVILPPDSASTASSSSKCYRSHRCARIMRMHAAEILFPRSEGSSVNLTLEPSPRS
jgi:hypothetical protein